jgi:hypothetical protein
MGPRRARLARAVGYVWLGALAVALLAAAAHAVATTKRLAEHAAGCDAFGYLRMAKEVRRGAADGRAPDYRIETPHTRLLVEFFRARDVPPKAWAELVAPHAHHYFPGTDSVGPQYPPGTALAFALFPPGEAAHGVDRAAIAALVGAGLLALAVAARARAWAAAGGVVFALQTGLAILAGMNGLSFSVNALLAPLLAAVALVFVAAVLGAARPWAALAAAFLAGACLGFGVLVRLPVLFLLPGALVPLLGTTRRTLVGRAAAALLAGFGLCGVLPLLAHQHQITGSWLATTYGPDDSAPPSLAAVAANYEFYFGDGPGGRYNGALLVTLVGCVGVVLAARLAPGEGAAAPVGGGRVLLAALTVWGVSAAYFLTHRIAIPYYQIPATFAATLVLAFGALAVGSGGAPAGGPEGTVRPRRAALRWLALGVAFVPGAWALDRAVSAGVPQGVFAEPAKGHSPTVPAELADERAWVFADFQTGPLWYYGERPAYKAPFADAATLATVYRFIHARGEPLYVVRDSPSMAEVVGEIERLGGTLEERGNMDGSPFFLVRWPAAGPRT